MRGTCSKSTFVIRSCLFFKIWTLSILWVVSNPAKGQVSPQWQHELAKNFGEEGQVEYLHLVGYMNRVIYTDMKFAYEDDIWVGTVEYPDEDLSYSLEGGPVGDQYVFLEYDQEGQQIGFWTIRRNMEKYHCDWRNLANTMDFKLVMYDELWNPDFKKDYHCQFFTFRGDFESTPLEIELIRDQENYPILRVYDLENSERLDTKVRCANRSCSQLDIDLEEPHGKQKLYRAVQSFDRITMSRLTEQSGMPQYQFTQKENNQTLLRKRLEMKYYVTVEYPNLDEYAEQARVLSFVEDTFLRLSRELDSLTTGMDEPDRRLMHFANVWFEIHFWNEELISGKWNIQKSWDNKVASFPFNFDLSTDRDIELTKQFRSGFDIDYFLEQYIQQNLRELSAYKDLFLRNRVRQANFHVFNFNRGGLVISTDFDTILGTLEMEVPWNELEPYLKKKSELRKVISRR